MIAHMTRRRETPRPRTNPSGKKVWQARWTDKAGRRRMGYPPDIKGTHPTKREAQAAIDACYERDALGPARPDTVGGYAATWMTVHPRAPITVKTNTYRLGAVLDIVLEGAPLRDWPFEMLRRRHANAIADHLLRDGRAYSGVNSVLGTLSAMCEDAIEDEVAVTNPFRGMKKIRKNDPRITKAPRPIRVWDWAQMHQFAAVCAAADSPGAELTAWRRVYAEPMIRMLSDCGLRIGELFPLCRSDLSFSDATLTVGWSVSDGKVVQGTKTDHGDVAAGRVVPVPPDLLGMLDRMPKRLDAVLMRGDSQERLLFPAPRGSMWLYHCWIRDVWNPGRKALEVDIRPHELRHSWISLLRGAGVDPADVAAAGGHTLQTATRTYTHALGRSFDAMRTAVGE